MLGYHRQARILGATRPDVNEIVVCRANAPAQSLHYLVPSSRRPWPGGTLDVQVKTRQPVSLNP